MLLCVRRQRKRLCDHAKVVGEHASRHFVALTTTNSWHFLRASPMDKQVFCEGCKQFWTTKNCAYPTPYHHTSTSADQKNAKSKTIQLGPDHFLVPSLTSPPMPQKHANESITFNNLDTSEYTNAPLMQPPNKHRHVTPGEFFFGGGRKGNASCTVTPMCHVWDSSTACRWDLPPIGQSAI